MAAGDGGSLAGHSRRQFLLGALLLSGLAGCASAPGGGSAPSPSHGLPGRIGAGAGQAGARLAGAGQLGAVADPLGDPDANPITDPDASIGGTSGRAASAGRSPGPPGVLNVVAHPDDDLLFLSPALLQSIQSGVQVRTIFLTAGDDGRPGPYWQHREAGIFAAYALMAGVPNVWRSAPSGLVERTAWTLAGAPEVGVLFLRLPDGGPGHGFTRYGGQSLPQLWRGTEASITAVDGRARYTRDSLIGALLAIMRFSGPLVVRTQDFHGRFGDGDHGDHHAAAYLTRAASQRFGKPHRLESYQDYATSSRPVNVSGELLRIKQQAFATYAGHDRLACDSGDSRCAKSFWSWQLRQYRLSTTGGVGD